MMEQQWGGRPHLIQPFGTAPIAPMKSPELSSGPTFKCAIDVLEEAEHRGRIERAVVLPPPSYHWVVEPGHLGKRNVGLATESPPAHRLPHPLQSIRTCPREEAREEPVVMAASLPWPKREAEKGEAHVRILLIAIAVLAVHDLRFVRVHRQPAIPQPGRDGSHHVLRLLPTATVNHRIISITRKWAVGIGA